MEVANRQQFILIFATHLSGALVWHCPLGDWLAAQTSSLSRPQPRASCTHMQFP